MQDLVQKSLFLALSIFCFVASVEAQEPSSPIARFIGIISSPALAIEEWSETGTWPSAERFNELAQGSNLGVTLCKLSVAEATQEPIRIEYSFLSGIQNECSESFLALVQRNSEDDQCFKYSITQIESSEEDSMGGMQIANVCPSDGTAVSIDVRAFLRSAAREASEQELSPEQEALRQEILDRLLDSPDQ